MAAESGSEFDLAERERIRQALLSYMREHKIGTPTLAKRIEESHPKRMNLPLKTLQRFLGKLKPLPEEATAEEIERAKPLRSHDMALIICKAFVEKLPNKPTAMQALGEALHAVYGKLLHNVATVAGNTPDPTIGVYSVSAHEATISEITVTASRALTEDQAFLIVKETASSTSHRIYDGVLVSTGSAYLVVLKDRLMHTARVHALHLPSTGYDFHGIVYDNGPVREGGLAYALLPTSLVYHFNKSYDAGVFGGDND